jgi:ppGpp synthetase/RelA/SpoT-type nucleotidyltranferase
MAEYYIDPVTKKIKKKTTAQERVQADIQKNVAAGVRFRAEKEAVKKQEQAETENYNRSRTYGDIQSRWDSLKPQVNKTIESLSDTDYTAALEKGRSVNPLNTRKKYYDMASGMATAKVKPNAGTGAPDPVYQNDYDPYSVEAIDILYGLGRADIADQARDLLVQKTDYEKKIKADTDKRTREARSSALANPSDDILVPDDAPDSYRARQTDAEKQIKALKAGYDSSKYGDKENYDYGQKVADLEKQAADYKFMADYATNYTERKAFDSRIAELQTVQGASDFENITKDIQNDYKKALNGESDNDLLNFITEKSGNIDENAIGNFDIEDLKVYKYLVKKGDDEAAKAYQQYMVSRANEQAAANKTERLLTTPESISKNLELAGLSVQAGLEGSIMGAGQVIGRATGDMAPVPYTVNEQAYQNMRQYMNEGQGFAADALYSAGNMIIPVAVSFIPVAGQIASTAFVGVSAGGNAYRQARAEGKQDNEAIAYGVMTGASEAAMQYALGGYTKISGTGGIIKATGLEGKLTKTLQKVSSDAGVQAKLALISKYASQAGSEFVEEYLQQYLQPVYRNIAFDEKNEVKFFTEENLRAGIMGAINAAAMNAPQYFSEPINIAQLGKENAGNIGNLVSLGLENTQGTDANKYAASIQSKIDSGGTPTNFEIGSLAAAVQEETNARIDGFKRGKINYTGLTDSERVYFVDPRNYEAINETFGTELTGTESPMEIRLTLDDISKKTDTAGTIQKQTQVTYDAATQKQAEFNGFLQGISDTLGLQGFDGNQKTIESMISKVNRHIARGQKYTVADMYDHVRGVLFVNDYIDIASNIAAVEKELRAKGISYKTKDYFKNPTPWGYRGFHISYSLGDGINAEIQFATKDVWNKTKLESDKLYEKWRNKDYSSLSANEETEFKADRKKSMGMWDQLNLPDKINSLASHVESANPLNISSVFSGERAGFQAPPKNSSAPLPPSSGSKSISRLDSVNTNRDLPSIKTPPSKDIISKGKENSNTSDQGLPENATAEEIDARTRPMIMTTSPRAQKTPAAEAIFTAWDAFKRKMVDSANTIAYLGKITGDKNLYNILNNARQSHQAGEFMIGLSITGQPTYQANFKGEKVGESLADIWNPIKAKGEGYYQDFMLYLQHAHNVDRMSIKENTRKRLNEFELENPALVGIAEAELAELAKGGTDEAAIYAEYLQLINSYENAENKPVFGYDVTAGHSMGLVQEFENQHPEFKELAAKVYKYNDNLLNYRVNAGLLSKEGADLLREMYSHYVPTFRNQASAKGAGKQGTKVQINQTIKKATGSDLPLIRIDDSMTAQTMQVVSAAKKNQLGLRLLDIARRNSDAVGSYIKAVRENKGLTYDIDDQTGTVYAEQSKDDMINRFTIYENGRPTTMDVSPGVFEGISSLVASTRGPQWAVKANDMYKRLITGYNPMFLARNFFRDIQDAGLYSKNLGLFIKNYPKAWKEMATNGGLWRQYQALGGFNSSFFDYNKGLESKHGALQRWTIDKIELANMMIEQAPRFAEFLATVEKGGASYENLMQAMYNAADVTVNFGRSGTWGKVLNSTFVPFFNPSIQGFDRLIRRFTETKGVKGWTMLVLRAAAMGIVPSLLNAMLYDDDDEYKLIDDRTKDTYYLLKMGDGIWAKVPKGRALSVFGSGAQRLLRAARGERDAFAGFIGNMYDQTAPVNPLTANIATPVISTMFNKTWYGGNIENQSMQNMRPEDRYDAGTDAFSIWLGGVLKQSPKKINYLLDSYSGVIGDIALPLMAKRAKQNPFTKAFTLDTVYSNRISDDFYNMKQELTFQENTEPVSDVPSETDLVLRLINRQENAISDLYKEIREIEDSNIPNSEKRQKVRELRVIISGVQQTVLQGVPAFQNTLKNEYDIDEMLSIEEQKAQAEKVYFNANKKTFGSEYALRASGKDVYEKAVDLNNSGTSFDTYADYYFASKGLSKDIDKKSVLTGMKLSEKDIENIYSVAIETKDTKKERSIAYASDQGVRPSAFLHRSIQKSNEEGDKTGSSEVYLVEGRAVLADGTETVDGTKKREAMKSLLSSGYSEVEKAYFYENEYSNDQDYVWAMVADISLDEYLTLKRDEWDIHGEIDPETGRTKTGTKKAASIEYVKTLNLNGAQRAILLMTAFNSDYALETSDYKDIAEYIAGLDMTISEKIQLANAIGLVTSENTIYPKKKKT